MFSLIKKYQRGAEETVQETVRHADSGFSGGERRMSMFDERVPLHNCETTSTPKLTKMRILY